ncbi:dnaJ-like protein subfamily C member 3-like protein [Pyrus ussuriensis x Pyrus communis]|uniref:DnaJ-like protein subfamily C member 3-like protein n=1 Tax=Pyrus ussuriensis x Pyrus communis TaxID=2448454 RepID=A0A5N5HNC2_9ROSA|nr:dnaJ-like protein subfamily C member 3-like protein [Pyrus ussuriensis x Pyrus communis]
MLNLLCYEFVELYLCLVESIKVKRYSEALNDLNATIEADPFHCLKTLCSTSAMSLCVLKSQKQLNHGLLLIVIHTLSNWAISLPLVSRYDTAN